MNFIPYGPVFFERDRDNDRLLLLNHQSREEFWSRSDELDPGLSDACGCYVFAIGNVPWYVGKSERQNFKRECLTDHKIQKYNYILQLFKTGRPCLYFYARITSIRKNFSKPTAGIYRDIRFLERMLIGIALRKNNKLLNVQETRLLRGMCVPGLINTHQGAPTSAMRSLRRVMGYE